MPNERTPRSTPRFDALVAEAGRIAVGLGHQHTGAEHLMMALLRDPDAVPTQVLAELVDPVEIDKRLLTLVTSPTYHENRHTDRPHS
ncbi:Clp protease N-terminal domain-containing protein [Streptomyces sp. NPDC048442]|uniref:Clp protease N-terminal domain-containing protein n=1 Tax=Streptomyces sp. NPDC048442 TaxID=3154823 RepID=UPI00343463B6